MAGEAIGLVVAVQALKYKNWVLGWYEQCVHCVTVVVDA